MRIEGKMEKMPKKHTETKPKNKQRKIKTAGWDCLIVIFNLEMNWNGLALGHGSLLGPFMAKTSRNFLDSYGALHEVM